MKVGGVRKGSVEKGLMNGQEGKKVLPKGENSKKDSFWMGPQTTTMACGLMSMGSQDCISSNWLVLRFQNSCSGNQFNGFC